MGKKFFKKVFFILVNPAVCESNIVLYALGNLDYKLLPV